MNKKVIVTFADGESRVFEDIFDQIVTDNWLLLYRDEVAFKSNDAFIVYNRDCVFCVEEKE